MSIKKKKRIQRINQMLLEMASGNFFYRLKRSTRNDNLVAITISLNMLAEEIQETMLHQGYANSNTIIIPVIQMSFVINEQGTILMTNQQTANILSVLHADIVGKSFETFLAKPSKTVWTNTWHTLKQKELYDTAVNLTFKTKGNLLIPKTCYITTFKGKESTKRRTLVTVIHHSNNQDRIEQDLKRSVIQFTKQQKDDPDDTVFNAQKPKVRLSFEDIRKIREGHDIIINNLEQELPSLKDFALQLGTNEFKLKYGFKELYGTTVYRFLTQERLRKSKMMIQYSDQSLKSIAHMTGFKSMSRVIRH